MHIARIEPLILHVSARTNWFFIRVIADTGAHGLGEATLNGWEPVQRAFLQQAAPNLEGRDVAHAARTTRVHPHAPAGLVGASILSALEQALSDLLAQDAGMPLRAWLGDAPRPAIPVYA